ncbi:hypothetical protein [Terriglobus tenax]|uniref:hypothetical protein n=1 Tax=Terriglobus tenax TaxID=1111115 RepID=UPI0021DF7E3D|nr:hypothetical protein [Terriglobus tenax]
MMRKLLIALCVFTTPALLTGQAWKPAEMLRSQRESVHQAYQQPWHRILSFQLFDRQGRPSQSGTVEDLYESPASQRRIVNSTRQHFTVYTSSGSAFTDTRNASLAPALLLALEGFGDTGVPEVLPHDRFLAEHAPGRGNLACFGTQRTDESGMYAVSLVDAPTTCFQATTGELRAVKRNGIVTAILGWTTLFGYRVPGRIAILGEEGKIAELAITTLEPLEHPLDPLPASHLHPAHSAELASCDQGGYQPVGLPQSQTPRLQVYVHVDRNGKPDTVQVLSRADTLTQGYVAEDLKHRAYSPCMVGGNVTDFSFITSVYRPDISQVSTAGFLSGWNSYMGPGAYSDPNSLSNLSIAGW